MLIPQNITLNYRSTALIKLTGLIFFLILGIVKPPVSFAADCAPGECGSWQTCENGTYCCNKPAGCPSWDCEDNGCCWFQLSDGSGVCRRKYCPGGYSCQNAEGDLCRYSDPCPSGCTRVCWGGLQCPSNPDDTGACSYDSTLQCFACEGLPACSTSSPATPSLINPSDGAVLYNKSSLKLDWEGVTSWGEDCQDIDSRTYRVYVDKSDGAGFVLQGSDLAESVTELNYSLDTGTTRTYKWYVVADNGPKESTSATFTFENYGNQNLTVYIQEIPTSTVTCPTTSMRNLAGVSVTVSVLGAQADDNQTFMGTTGTDGKFTLSVPYSTATPPEITICPTYSDGMCQSYGIKCSESDLNSTLQTCATVAQVTTVSSQTITLQMAKVIKDPWVAVVDGDAYAGSFTNTGPCTSETSVNSGFYLGMLNLNKLEEGSLGSNIYALSVRGSNFSTDISEGSLGGYVQNIVVEDSDSQKMELKVPEGAKVMTNLGGYLRPDVYKISAADFNNSSWQYYFLSQITGLVESHYYGTSTDTYFGAKCYPGDIFFRPGGLGNCDPRMTRLYKCIGTTCYVRTGNISPRVAFVYVEGNPSDTIVIDRPINGIEVPGVPTSPGNVVIITRAHVKIDPSLSTLLSTYTIDTPPQIEAIIISSSGIEVGSNYTEASPDNPVVFYGSLISTKSGSASGKGLQILRDLGLNNNTYPSVVVNYPLSMLDRITKSIKFNSKWGVETGLEIFDVQYEFDDVGEAGN